MPSQHFDISKYLGKKWKACACGPEAFDCWGLIVDIYKKQFGITLSIRNDIARGRYKDIDKVIQNDAATNWDTLLFPIDFCVVCLSNNKRITHVGCYFETDKPYIIHSKKSSGVVVESLQAIRQQYKHISYHALRN